MAEGEGTSFENPAFDPDNWGDDDDDESGGGDETTPFIPNSASTPGPSGEEIPMQTTSTKRAVCLKRLVLKPLSPELSL